MASHILTADNENVIFSGSEGSVIQEFYRDANVFITGATGFLGKVLIEKLLRSCPDVNNIYLLVRSKRGKQIEERIDELVKSPCFDRLKEERPGFESKLVAVAGDIGVEGLGISDQDRHLLAEHVNIVFHVAATVKFDEQLNVAIKQNVRGTRDLLVMCKSFSKLKCVVHVSTAYSNCPSPHIAEDFSDLPLTCDVAVQMAEDMRQDLVDSITPQILGKWPNSYSFTKAIAEDTVRKYAQDLPIGIFRPSIVVCTNEEPVPGWIDNLYGPNGIIVACVSGVLRTMQCDETMDANIVPCDKVIGGLIASAWDVHERRLKSTSCPIYNFVNPASNAITWQHFMIEQKKSWVDIPVSRAIWHAMIILTNSHFLYLIYRFFLHTLPALLADTGLYMTGNKPQMQQAYRKIHKLSGVLTFFSTRQWDFDDANVADLWTKLSDQDKSLFQFSMRHHDWEKYIKYTCMGIRKHLLGEGPETLPEARRRAQRLFWLHLAVVTTIVCFLAWIVYYIITYFIKILLDKVLLIIC